MKMLKLLGSTLVELLNNLDFLHVGLARLTMLHAALTWAGACRHTSRSRTLKPFFPASESPKTRTTCCMPHDALSARSLCRSAFACCCRDMSGS